MRLRLDVIACVGVAVTVTAVPVRAHHSWPAVFSEDKPVTLRGTLKKVELVNPHGWIWLDVKNPDGTVTTWGIEGGAPNALIRHGVTKNTLKIGEELIVNGYLARDGSNQVGGVSYTRADGQQFFLGGAAPGADPGAEGPAGQK